MKMNRILTTMRQIGICSIMIAIIISAWFATSATKTNAAQTTNVKVQVIIWGPPVTMLPAGDDDNHLVGLGQRSGEAVFSDGRKAKYSNVFFLDLFRGKEAPSWGYTKMVFEDGAWLFFKWNSNVVGRDEAGNPVMKGKGTILKGTGSYQGIKGTAEFTNKRLPPTKEHPEGATMAEAILAYTLP